MTEQWRNWSQSQSCTPAVIETPDTEAGVVDAVQRALGAKRGVRVAGAGHSFTDAVCTDGALLQLDGLDRVVDVDRTSGLVTVEAGIRLHELGSILASHGLAMENLGDIDVQSVAGAVSTGTHGTGSRLGNISSQVAGLRLVNGKGEIVDVDASDDSALRAARVSIGALGVITRVTLRCVPLFTLHRRDVVMDLDEVLANLDERADAHDHFEFFVFPYASKCLVKMTDRVDGPAKPASSVRRYAEDVLLENRAFAVACRAGRRFPKLIPRINRLSASLAGGTDRTDVSHNIFATRRDVRFNEMEYGLPRAAGATAVRGVMRLVADSKLNVNFPIEVRHAAADDAYLSSASGRDTCYVAVHMYAGMPYENYFRAVEQIMDSHGGRPHWGKHHFQTAATLRSRYPEWDEFAKVRAGFDPDSVFTNRYARRVLGPVLTPATV